MKRIARILAAAIIICLINNLIFAQDTTLTITNGGNVGIGTTSPTSRLHVIGSAGVGDLPRFSNHMLSSRVDSSNSTVDVAVFGSNERTSGFAVGVLGRNLAASGFGVYSQGNFHAEGNATILGNLGIGTTAPSVKLHVQTAVGQHGLGHTDGIHNFLTWLGTGGGGYGDGAWIGPSFPHALHLQTNNMARMTIDSSGNVGIGTGQPDQLLSVNGNASKVGGGSWATFSDRRLKQDIQSFSDGLAVLRAIRPVTFRYNGMLGYPTDKTYVGVIAQEIQSVAPFMVDTFRTKLNSEDDEETDILRFDGSALTYMLINAVKELDAKVGENRTLLKENQELSARLTELESLVRTLAAEKKADASKSMAQLQ